MKKNPAVDLAIKLHLESGLSGAKAADQAGCSRQSLYSALQRRELALLKGSTTCPCCASIVDPSRIDEAMLSAAGKKKLSK